MKGKTVCLTANTSWYLFNFRNKTIKSLVKLGFNVVCVCPEDKYSEKLINLGCEHVHIEMDNKGVNPLRDFLLMLQFFFVYSRVSPDYILNFTIKNNIYSPIVGRLFTKDIINNVSGLGTAFIKAGLLSKLILLLYRFSFKLTKKIFCQNPDDLEFLSVNRIVAPNKLGLLPGSGVDTSFFVPDESRFRNEHIVFLYIGRILGDKGLRELVAAVHKTRTNCSIPFKLLLCGSNKSDNRTLVPEIELNSWLEDEDIEWMDHTDSIKDVLSIADYVVLPSYREGLPRSLLEAGSMRIPCITTNVPGCKQVIEDGFNGFVCESRNVDSLALAIQDCLELSDSDYQRMSSNSRLNVIDNFEENIVVSLTLNSLFD